MRLFALAFFVLQFFAIEAFAQCTLSPTAVCDGVGCPNEPRPHGHILFNSDHGVIQYCSGSQWRAWIYGELGNSLPLFIAQENLARSTLYESNITLVTPQNGTSISIEGDGSPEYRICNDSSCSVVNDTWSSTIGLVDQGEWVQLRATTSPLISTTFTIALNVGDASTSWSITTTSIDIPAGCSNVGDVCSDSSIYAGTSPDGAKKMYIPDTMPSNGQWFSDGIFRGTTNSSDGDGNTAILAAFGAAAHPPAHACENYVIHGKSDWYLASQDEAQQILNNIGTLNPHIASDLLWTSTEVDASNAYRLYISLGNIASRQKTYNYTPLCVRKDP